MATLRIPRIKEYRALYTKKVSVDTLEKIDKISAELDVAKWVIIDKVLSEALGTKTKNAIDIKKWLKCK